METVVLYSALWFGGMVTEFLLKILQRLFNKNKI